MTEEVYVYIDATGWIEFVHDDAVATALLGQGVARTVTRRASHVEPVLYRGDDEKALRWEVDLSPALPWFRDEFSFDPVVGPYDSRAEALAAEVAWLELRHTYGVGWMTKPQLGKSAELRRQGWDVAGVMGDGEGCGAPTVMRDPQGRLHKVDGRGDVTLLEDDEVWTAHLPPAETQAS